MTDAELALGESTVKAFLQQALGWKAMFVPEYAEEQAAATVIRTADAQVGDIPTKEHAAALSIYKAISDAGYGSQVTSSQCAALAHAVYQAVLKRRTPAL